MTTRDRKRALVPDDARTISRMLAGRAAILAAELLPAGRREGAEWRVGSVGGERGNSCAVHLFGDRAGVWSDFSTGETGDALDLVAAVLFRGGRRDAIRWSKRWLGLAESGDAPPPEERRAVAAESAGSNSGGRAGEAEQLARQAAALRLFLAARPQLAGTPAAAYLLGRGIDLGELGRQPRSLRYLAECWHEPSRRTWPALVAAISGPDGTHVATHRTYLGLDAAGRWMKAPVQPQKMALGRVRGGTVRLWRGASGQPLAAAPTAETVVIGEGIETCLSIAVACPELRILSAVSLGNLASVMLPPAIGTVILAADNDTAPAAQRGLQRAVDAFLAQGRQVRIARSPMGKDFNDALRQFSASTPAACASC